MSLLNTLYDHHRDILGYMNEERKKQNLCDVKLVVRGEVVHAHKGVLAAESEYFRTLFNGQFSDSDKNEIDLTSAVTNADDLERVVNFIYTCQVEITSQNLPEIARLASFFLMKNMRVKIQEFMRKNLSRETCLQYYFYAKRAGLSDIEGMASLMLKVTFHNFHINMDETLDITPDDLKDFQEKGYLNFCDIMQVTDFIAKWVGRHHTEEHVTLASEVLTAVMEEKSLCPKSSLTKKQVEKSFAVMLSDLNEVELYPADNRKVADFVETFQKALGEVDKSVTKHKTENNSDESTSTGKGKRRKTEDAGKNQREVALVALGKIKDDSNDDSDYEFDVFNEKPLDVCIYVPSSRCWFHYCTVPHKSIAFTCDFYEDEKIVEFLMVGDYIVTYSYEDHYLNFYNHKRKSGSTVTKDTMVNGSGSLLDSFFTVHTDTLYMVNRYVEFVSSSSNEGCSNKVHLIGYRLDDKMKFAKIFETEPLAVTGGFEYDKDCGPVRETEIKISSKTNEMLIVHSTFDDLNPSSSVVYLVKLRARNSPVKVLLNTKNEKKSLRECHIVEMDDRFLIVREDSDKTRVLCEYVFLSEQVNYKTGYTAGELLYDSYKTKTFPHAVTVNGTHCLWHLEVYLKKLCILKSADFNENKKMTVSEHTPAPYSKIYSVHETSLPEAFLKKLKKVV